MVVDLDPQFPILFFPIRIETKYSKFDSNQQMGKLRIRFYPDQISIDTFDPRLTKEEIQDAKAYWTKVKSLKPSSSTFVEQRDLAWQQLVQKYNCARAAYIAKSVILYHGKSSPDPLDPTFRSEKSIKTRKDDEHFPPVCKILPRYFIIYAKFKDGEIEPVKITGKPIPNELKLAPFYSKINPDVSSTTDDPIASIDPELKWLTDFDVAVQNGMAVEIQLNRKQYNSGFDYIIAYGVRDNLTPKETRHEVENLFRAHRYTDSFIFLKQGIPTNLTKGQAGEYSSSSSSSSSQTDLKICRSIEFSGLDNERTESILNFLTPDGRIFERALGIGSTAQGVQNANNRDQADAISMSTALWPVAAGSFLNRVISGLILPNLRYYFIKYVKGQGSIPPFRIGKIPYGILPVTISSKWKDSTILPNTDFIRSFFTYLRTRWVQFINDVPTVMKATRPPPPSENEQQEINLLNILSMRAASHSYYIRGVRSLYYIHKYLTLAPGIEFTLELNTFRGFSIENINTLLSLTFPPSILKNFEGFIDNIYDLVLGTGLTPLNFPLVKDNSQDKDTKILYIKQMYENIEEFLKPTSQQTGILDYNTLLFKFLKYSASFVGETTTGETSNPNQTKEFKESLKDLSEINSDKLESLMLQTLDLSSYRLDAWLSSFANERLEHLRNINKKGLYMGAFGWIENLIPKAIVGQQEQQSTKPVDPGGYIYGPSYAHAAAAAVLRNGYLTHSNDSDKKDLLKINMNSERTKDALEIIHGIQNMSLAELLGYRFERRLHDSSIDYLIDEFRKHFPLKKDDLKELQVPSDQLSSSKERIVPRNLADGLLIYKSWERLTKSISSNKSIETLMKEDKTETWKPFYDDIISKKYNASIVINQIKPHLNYLLDLVDGLSDLCMAESVYQAVNGNYDRSAAALDGLSGDGQIPIPEILNTSRSGRHQTQRIVLAFEVEPLKDLKLIDADKVDWKNQNPREVAEPNLNKLFESYYGDISFWLDVIDQKGNVISTKTVGLSDLGLKAIDLLYIENWELNSRLTHYGKTSGLKKFVVRYNKKILPDNDNKNNKKELKSLPDLQFLIRSLQEIVAQGQPLKYSDFLSPENIDSFNDEIKRDIAKEIFQRFYNTLILQSRIIKELRTAKHNKKEALMRASLFGIPSAIPLGRDDNILDSDEDLDKKIDSTLKELESDQFLSYEPKLRDWRARLKDPSKGEKDLLDEISPKLEEFLNEFKNILKNKAFLVLSPFKNPRDILNDFKNTPQINKKALKWIQKAAYVRPRLKLFDDVIIFNEIFDSANFSFYYDESKFNLKPEKEEEASLEQKGKKDPISIIVALSNKTTGTTQIRFPPASSQKLAGLVIDEWVEKISNPSSGITTSAVNLLVTSVIASGNDGNIPSNAIDNDLNTRWSNLGIGSWIRADLGSQNLISSVDIAWYKGKERQNNFVISVSNDGSTFTNKFAGKSSGKTLSVEKYNLPPNTVGRYIKITVNGNTQNNWASITEIDFYGPGNEMLPKEDSAIAFHYDSPNTEPPQSLLLAVSPNDEFTWNEDTILQVLYDETMELMKIRAVDYHSIKDLRQFLPTIVLESFGSNIYTKLYDSGDDNGGTGSIGSGGSST